MNAVHFARVRDHQRRVVGLAAIAARQLRAKDARQAKLSTALGDSAMQVVEFARLHARLGRGNIDAVADGLRFRKADNLRACLGGVIEKAKNRPLVDRERVRLPALRESDAKRFHGGCPSRIALTWIPSFYAKVAQTRTIARCRQEPTSALAQLKSRVGNSRRIRDAAWHKEVCHAKVVCRSTDEARTS